jgi:hypothetical protein
MVGALTLGAKMVNGKLIQVLAVIGAMTASASAQALKEQPEGWTKVISLELVAPEFKRSGETWDLNPVESPFICVPGTPACAGTSRVGSTRPDMWLTIIDAEGNSGGYQVDPSQRVGRSTSRVQNLFTPAATRSSARCPDALTCLYRDIRVPDGAFGVVVLDEDVKEHDFMLAGIVYDPDKVDDVTIDKIEQHVHDYIENLRLNRQLAGGPAAGDPIELRAAKDCTNKVCFLDELAGVAGLKLTLSQPLTPGVRCSASTISGALDWNNDAKGDIKFHFDEKANSCSGTLGFSWDFGDGDEASSPETTISHRYDKPGDYTVIVTPSCSQRARSCQGAPATQTINVK